MNIPATVIAWVALAVSIIAGIFAFAAGRGDGQEAVQKQVADLAARVEAVKPFDPGDIEKRIADLAAKVEALKPADSSGLEKQVAELAAKVEAVKPFDPSGLEQQVTDLTARLEAVKPFDPAPLQAKLDDLDSKIAALPGPESFDPSRIQERIDELGRKVTEMPAPEPFDPAPLRRQLDELARKVTAVEEADPAALQARVDDLASRIAALKPFDPAPILKRIDALNAAMASRDGGSGGAAIGKQRLLGQVFFDTNSSRISDEAKAKLDAWVSELSGKPHRLGIIGFADSVGRATYNVALSIRRAAAVRSYLLRAGLADGSVVVSAGGYGEEGAPVPTDDDTDEPQNRTVHVYVYE